MAIIIIFIYKYNQNKTRMKTILKTIYKNNITALQDCKKTQGIYTDVLPEIKKVCSCYFTKTNKLLGCTDHNKNIIDNIINTTAPLSH